MPQSRKRPGNHQYRKSSGVPARQRVRGRVLLALLFGVFGLLISMFIAGENYAVWIAGGLIGAALGYLAGKNMEKDAGSKSTA